MSDELDANPFFTSLKHSFRELYQEAAAERWLICVPHSESLTGECLPITESFARMHILSPSPYFAGEFESPDGHMCEVEDTTIKMGQGYEEEGREVTILSEEVFYNKEYKSHRVITVSSPFLGGTPIHVRETAPTPSEDLVPVESRTARSLSNWLVSMSGAGEVLKRVDASIRKFNRTYEIIEGFEEEAARRLEELCFNAKSHIFAVESVQEYSGRTMAHGELVEEAVEGYVMSGVHGKVWESLVHIYEAEDLRLERI